MIPNYVLNKKSWKQVEMASDKTITIPVSWDKLEEICFRVLGKDYASFGYKHIPKISWHYNGEYNISVNCYDTGNNFQGYATFVVSKKNNESFVITVSGDYKGSPVAYYK